jgi:hypothetical protein
MVPPIPVMRPPTGFVPKQHTRLANHSFIYAPSSCTSFWRSAHALCYRQNFSCLHRIHDVLAFFDGEAERFLDSDIFVRLQTWNGDDIMPVGANVHSIYFRYSRQHLFQVSVNLRIRPLKFADAL